MKTSLLRFIAFLPAILWAAMATGAPLTPEKALERALASSANKAPAATKSSYSLAYDEPGAIYVFNSSKDGFIAVAADDAAPALLGYSDSSAFDADNMPPAMKWWLEEYGRQIAAAGPNARPFTPSRAPQGSIAPVLRTKWNQGEPYNNKCPKIGNERTVTGCVATAMAQVMNYHQWPEKGTGSHSYSTNTLGLNLSMNFGSTSFDWNNMLDSYSDLISTDAQTDAVAILMYACGVSVDMDYTTYASGAQSSAVASALLDYFNYDKSVCCLNRDYYTLAEWQDLVYSQLKDYGPVLYSGANTASGHAFVVDGYSSDGYFHLNWGWGGVSDGYFLLSALDPENQGIGGSQAGYNFYQNIIANVCRPRPGSNIYPNILISETLTVSPGVFGLGSEFTLYGGFYNYSAGPLTGNIVACFTNKDTGEEILADGGAYFADMKPDYGFKELDFGLPNEMPEGSYTLSLEYCDINKNRFPIKAKTYCNSFINVFVKGTTVVFGTPTLATIEVSDMKMLSDLYLDEPCHLSISISNPSKKEFYGSYLPVLVDSSGTIVATAESIIFRLDGGQSTVYDFIGTFKALEEQEGSLKPGQYTFLLLDLETYDYIAAINVTLKLSSGEHTLSASDFRFIGNPAKADPEKLEFSATVSCSEGYFGGSLYVVLFTDESDYAITKFAAEPIFISAGQSAIMKAKGSFADAVNGKTYHCYIFDTSVSPAKHISKCLNITADCNTSGTDVPDTAGPRSIRVFNMQGMLVLETESNPDGRFESSALPAGIYIVESVGSDGERSVRRMAVR